MQHSPLKKSCTKYRWTELIPIGSSSSANNVVDKMADPANIVSAGNRSLLMNLSFCTSDIQNSERELTMEDNPRGKTKQMTAMLSR